MMQDEMNHKEQGEKKQFNLLYVAAKNTALFFIPPLPESQ